MKFLFRILLLLGHVSFLLFYTGEILFSQTSKDLESKKLENIGKLNYSKNLLNQTSKSKNITLNQLTLIKQSIELRVAIVDNIAEELKFLKNDIDVNQMDIKIIEGNIKRLKAEYEQIIIAASKNLDQDFALMYIFSSQDINQAYQRIKYAKYLTRHRRDIVAALVKEEEYLVAKNKELFDIKHRNEILLKERRNELEDLDRDEKRSISMIVSLQTKERELKRQIAESERIQSELEKEIRRIIEEEAEKARKAKKIDNLTPEQKIISSDFGKNKGKLPWPSEQGVLTGKYGEQNHPVLKGIKITSNGIDINTSPGAMVRSVFNGEVTKVIAILGANYTVIIKHGEYRTVYQNLVDVKVKAGDKIKTKDVIGIVYTDQENVSKLHFELWRDKLTQNPEIWLSK